MLLRVKWNSFAILGLFCAAGSQLRVHQSTSWVVSGCLRMLSGAHDALTHSIRNVLQFRWLRLLVASCSCPREWSANDLLGIVFFYFVIVLCTTISSNFGHCSTSTSRCRPLLRTCGKPIWRESLALGTKHSWLRPAICKARTSRRYKRSSASS